MANNEERWPCGLRVMVVDNDTVFLLLMKQLLLQCNYKVVTCVKVQEAISLAMDCQESIDLVISEAFLPFDDGFLILKYIGIQLNIPVIMMSYSGEAATIMKYIANGACDFLVKPVRVKELRNIWQHVFRKQMEWQVKDAPHLTTNFAATAYSFAEHVDQNEETITDIQDIKKYRLNWTEQLHNQFVLAINILGIEKAVPKKILDIMNVHNLTREHVASHLQRYKKHMKKMNSEMVIEKVSDDGYSSEAYENQLRDKGLPGNAHQEMDVYEMLST